MSPADREALGVPSLQAGELGPARDRTVSRLRGAAVGGEAMTTPEPIAPLTAEEERNLRAQDLALDWTQRRGSIWVKRMTADWQTPTAEELIVHRLLATLDACREVMDTNAELADHWKRQLDAAHPPATVPDEGLREALRTYRRGHDASVTVPRCLCAACETADRFLSKPETGQELRAALRQAETYRAEGDPAHAFYTLREAFRAALSTTDDEVGEWP